MIEQIVLSVVAAAAYSIVFFAKKHGSKSPENWNPFKFAATLAVGIFVGLAYTYVGVDITQAKIHTQLAAYAGTIAIVETVFKALWRNVLKQYLG